MRCLAANVVLLALAALQPSFAAAKRRHLRGRYLPSDLDDARETDDTIEWDDTTIVDDTRVVGPRWRRRPRGGLACCHAGHGRCPPPRAGEAAPLPRELPCHTRRAAQFLPPRWPPGRMPHARAAAARPARRSTLARRSCNIFLACRCMLHGHLLLLNRTSGVVQARPARHACLLARGAAQDA